LKPGALARSLRIRFVEHPRAHRGRLGTGEGPGTEVHAGSFLRRGEIVLDTELLSSPAELCRILAHELFHFTWLRLGNTARRSYEELIEGECRTRVPGELGWSSELRKRALTARDRRERTRRWRDYLCESFCDTAAWLAVSGRRHAEFTLPLAQRRRRRAWFLSRREVNRMPL